MILSGPIKKLGYVYLMSVFHQQAKAGGKVRVMAVAFAVVALYVAGITGYMLAEQPQNEPELITEPVIRNKYVTDTPSLFDIHSREGLEEALAFNKIDERAYRVSIYDCREFSAALESFLAEYGFDAGICTLSYPDNVGHRIVWVRLPDQTVFVEPQNDRIMTQYELKTHYQDTVKIKMHNYNIKVASDEVIYIEN